MCSSAQHVVAGGGQAILCGRDCKNNCGLGPRMFLVKGYLKAEEFFAVKETCDFVYETTITHRDQLDTEDQGRPEIMALLFSDQ